MDSVETKVKTYHQNRFWSWFDANQKQIEKLIESGAPPELSALMSEGIALLNRKFGWEVGPYKTGLFLALSAKGDRKKLVEIREIINQAPSIAGWTFLCGRPRRDWKFHFELIDSQGTCVSVEAHKWRYTLVGFNSREFFDITIYAPSEPLKGLELRKAGWIVLIGALGENLADEKIGRLTMRRTVPPQDSGCVIDLFDHLNVLAGD